MSQAGYGEQEDPWSQNGEPCPEEERTQGSCGVAMGEQEQMFLPRLSSLWIGMSSNLWFPIFASLSSRFIIWGGSDGSKRIQLA